jgi:hypothetical protein
MSKCLRSQVKHPARETPSPTCTKHHLRILILPVPCLYQIKTNFKKHFQEGCPINKERGNLFAIPLKKLKVKIKRPVPCLYQIKTNFKKHFQEGCPIYKERGNLFAIPLKKLKVKIKRQEAIGSFKKLL